MKIDFSTALTGLTGEPIRTPNEDGTPGEVMTLGLMAINVLLTTLIDERTGQPENVAPVEKVRHAKLAQDIFSAKAPLDLPAEDIALLKDRIGRAGAPLAVARAWAILDPAPEDDSGNTASDRRMSRQAKGR